MPIYEYRCNGCGKRASLFFRSFSTPVEPVCPSCQSQDLQRLMSKVAILRTSEQQTDRLFDYERQGLGDLNDQFDPRDVDRWARKMGDQYDAELGTNFKDMAEQMASGDRPYDLYDPRGTFASALEQRYRALNDDGADDLMSDPRYGDMESAPHQPEPDFVREARETGKLPDGSDFSG
ncbi:MAG: zinc ribbon domain-containing protein [Chloroflexi bacterium]|nr:zinc ribbon domain-containing protein [Chloroflexota bacterium]